MEGMQDFGPKKPDPAIQIATDGLNSVRIQKTGFKDIRKSDNSNFPYLKKENRKKSIQNDIFQMF